MVLGDRLPRKQVPIPFIRMMMVFAKRRMLFYDSTIQIPGIEPIQMPHFFPCIVIAVGFCCAGCAAKETKLPRIKPNEIVRMKVGAADLTTEELIEYSITESEEIQLIASLIPSREDWSKEPEPMAIVRDAYLQIIYKDGRRQEITISETLGVVFDEEGRAAKVSPELLNYLRTRAQKN
jgi:hypothetical protein